jgi:hypothetical protein
MRRDAADAHHVDARGHDRLQQDAAIQRYTAKLCADTKTRPNCGHEDTASFSIGWLLRHHDRMDV